MKKLTSLVLIVLLLFSLPIMASAETEPADTPEIEPTLTVIPPTKVYYTVGATDFDRH